ncbi:hypothetical protein ASG22_12455 [Chryseobacterium sp. Leaf405]|uniref:carboxypeptidase regulatory-like domain-containing protein n=1 Tax=Chryseobacterium sp. Leaf405 TaxID=1736367 RepID=UPI0006F9BEAE|nr:carboxypeptidase regulatory-like domain-containing protein [Chryseobacterium sp. Leaf405]KQT23191.1 hypothetical protein ASG22_12455 [Chryseobacterium sp. Leaf405]
MTEHLSRKLLFTGFLFLYSFFFSQNLKNLKIIGAEDGKPIPNARIILPAEIIYTNDDGVAMIPENTINLEVSKVGYQTEKLTQFTPIIKLKLLYRDIEEIKITNIDIKKLFEDVRDNYSKRYYSKPSLYDIIFKQKYTVDDKTNSLVIAEAKFWALSNAYNFKFSNREDYDKFVQIELNNIKYFKFIKSDLDSISQTNVKKNEVGGNFFLNYELRRILLHINVAGAKYSGKIVADDNNEQTILFKIETMPGIKVEGTLLYNAIDKVITHYELDFDQSGFAPYKVNDKNGKEYEFQAGTGTISFDFYKKNNKYLPSQANIESDGYITFNGEKHSRTYERKVTFQTFREAKNESLPNRIDMTKNMWENIPNHEQKDSKIALSKEEQEFIDEK